MDKVFLAGMSVNYRCMCQVDDEKLLLLY